MHICSCHSYYGHWCEASYNGKIQHLLDLPEILIQLLQHPVANQDIFNIVTMANTYRSKVKVNTSR